MSPSHVPPDRPPAPDKSGRRRTGRAQDSHLIDPYKQTDKPHEPMFCTQCGAVSDRGRWRWPKAGTPSSTSPAGGRSRSSLRSEAMQPTICQACHRINDHFPAGIITLTGAIVGTHKDEIVRLIRDVEQAEKADHPLNRVMDIEDKLPDRLEISTTDIHLPHRIADAIRRAYKGDVTEHYDEGGYFVRVNWHREE